VLLDVAQLRRRRPIHDKPNGNLRFAALVTKPGEKYGLTRTSHRVSTAGVKQESSIEFVFSL